MGRGVESGADEDMVRVDKVGAVKRLQMGKAEKYKAA